MRLELHRTGFDWLNPCKISQNREIQGEHGSLETASRTNFSQNLPPLGPGAWRAGGGACSASTYAGRGIGIERSDDGAVHDGTCLPHGKHVLTMW